MRPKQICRSRKRGTTSTLPRADGLDAHIVWLDGREVEVRTLLLDEILHMAREGLLLLGADEDDIERYLSIAQMRVRTGQNGAAWQRAHVDKHARDFFRLTADYLEHQRSAMPVTNGPGHSDC